jgi:hypothetical protein
MFNWVDCVERNNYGPKRTREAVLVCFFGVIVQLECQAKCT